MKFNIDSVIKNINKPWTPVDLEKFDDLVLRIALFEGEYHEHSHLYDEFFFVYKGEIKIWTERGDIELKAGEGITIPKNLKHKPIARIPSFVLMIDSLKG
ncbi:hypothetical protein A3A05_01930 [Candidatus Nomurabacteria bacterium RIFCSPLOWO2_01_FULL_41_12]|uniref:Cupin type-2 domain-containing protein n=1 Tax=Candidatus Nomurabacteria bacterium RIFCSPLOWO2_01_FULL_41_12 TaxID=1801774 RepID=A0A1F6WWS2_9BACT|nr:MAG: hypothetical protein A3A05_01930 [Candidatus Nomurabacteria bacterium RIFCSPLOWO2_01_FULL_41_12]